MACLRASFASLRVLRSSASGRRLAMGRVDSGLLHSGQRSAKPGLSGFSSNSSVQTVQILIGKAIYAPSYDDHDALRKWVIGLRRTPRPSLTWACFRHSIPAHDRPDNLALPYRREARWRRDGRGLQSRRHATASFRRPQVFARGGCPRPTGTCPLSAQSPSRVAAEPPQHLARFTTLASRRGRRSSPCSFLRG